MVFNPLTLGSGPTFLPVCHGAVMTHESRPMTRDTIFKTFFLFSRFYNRQPDDSTTGREQKSSSQFPLLNLVQVFFLQKFSSFLSQVIHRITASLSPEFPLHNVYLRARLKHFPTLTKSVNNDKYFDLYIKNDRWYKFLQEKNHFTIFTLKLFH